MLACKQAILYTPFSSLITCVMTLSMVLMEERNDNAENTMCSMT